MALTREQFDKLRASGLSTEQIINFERGYVPEKKETFLQGLGRDIASPFIRGAELVGSAASLTGSSVKALYQTKTGQQEQAKQTMSEALKKAQDRTTAKVNVFGREEAPITTTRQAVGAGLEVGSNIIGGGAAKNVFQTGLKTGLKTLAKKGAKEGLAAGLTYGLGTGLQSEGGFGQVAKETALGGVTGLVGGAVLAPAIGAGEKVVYKLTNYGIKAVKDVAGAVNKKIKGVVTADDIERELLNIETGYAKTRKMMDFSKDAGSETRKRLISADVLSDVTDDAGIMRTKNPGGAKDQYKLKTIDGIEGLVKETLVKEGKSVSPDALKGKMINDIMNSGLEGKALKTALNNVDGEIEGLMLRATPNGEIPLDVIHDAKISTTNSIDFNTEAFVKAERKADAGSYKRIIEETSDEPIEAINKEIQKDYKVLELLDVLDGKRVKGGKLGKYFSQIGGNIVGGAVGSVGGPFGSAIGSVVGGEVAGKIKGQMLKNTFGQSIGSTIEKSGILVEASNKVKAPRLLLPAPKPGSPLKSYGSGPTINLPSKTQSTLDNAYSYNLGKRNIMYNTPNTTIKKPIKLKSNNNTSSITPVNKKVKPLPKSKGEILKSSLVQEVKKYKSASEIRQRIDELDNIINDGLDRKTGSFKDSKSYNAFKERQSLLVEEQKLQNKLISSENKLKEIAQQKADTKIRQLDPNIDKLSEADKNILINEIKKHSTLDEFTSKMRGSATQYGDYSPKLRKFVRPESVVMGDIKGLNPETVITVYRGIDAKSVGGKSIRNGDFVTTDYNDALAYTDSPSKVVSLRTKLKNLVAEYPDEVDISNPLKPVSYELLYNRGGDFIKITDSKLIELWNKANGKIKLK